jgi:murein DD-endopeptidase MepM/ murein hydrolase activator NlpD
MDVSYSLLRRLAVLGGILVVILLLLAANYGRILWRAAQYEAIKKRSTEIEANFTELEKLKAELSQIRQTEDKLKEILGVARQPAMLSVGDISRSQTLNAANLGEGQLPDTSEARPLPGGASTPSLMPVKGWLSARMTENHHGVDIAAREGDPVMAAADGVVTFAGWDEYFGNQIKISHGQKFTTMYGHNAKLFVKPEQQVLQGQIIALVGSTGRSSGPHLHYEVRIHGKPADPTYFWMNQ